ncbi:MAG TPA: hypothetical protein PLN06_07235 [Bacteroidales bacterium]|nr:hypothetical protein [Bacteroidales bacterium]HQJ21081.1 hypothetical protein [Bacteroidales bacterium]
MNILKSILFALFLILSGFVFYALHDGHFFLFHEDETIYYTSAKLFAETGSLKSASCINEEVSQIFQANWYGPMYQVFYGSIAKVFGFNNFYFIIVHLVLILISIGILYSIDTSKLDKILIIICFLSSEVTLSYIFTYFPESLHLFFSVILVFLLTRLNRESDSQKLKILYVILVFIFTLFRITFIFWLIGLIPFSKNRKELIFNALIFFAGVLFALFYMKFFTAPAFASGLKLFDHLFDFKIFAFIKSAFIGFFGNVYHLFARKSIVLYTLFLLFTITVIQLIQTRGKILLAAILIALLSLITLLSFYMADPFYLEKQVTFLFPLFIVTNVMATGKVNKLILIIFIGALPFSMVQTYKNIKNRRAMYSELDKNEDKINHFAGITNLVKQDGASIVQWVYSEHDFPNRITEAIIPISNIAGYPICYTTTITSSSDPDSIKFKRFGKLKIDYILSVHELGFDDIQLLTKNDYFCFYKIIN